MSGRMGQQVLQESQRGWKGGSLACHLPLLHFCTIDNQVEP
jgi:hypothetical protein